MNRWSVKTRSSLQLIPFVSLSVSLCFLLPLLPILALSLCSPAFCFSCCNLSLNSGISHSISQLALLFSCIPIFSVHAPAPHMVRAFPHVLSPRSLPDIHVIVTATEYEDLDGGEAGTMSLSYPLVAHFAAVIERKMSSMCRCRRRQRRNPSQ